jgi:hypothetical protein
MQHKADDALLCFQKQINLEVRTGSVEVGKKIGGEMGTLIKI